MVTIALPGISPLRSAQSGFAAALARALAALGGMLAAAVVPLALAQAPAWEAGSDGLLPIPALVARVTDLTQTLSAGDKDALEAKLADWEARTGNQLAVLLVPATQPEPIEGYSLRVAEAWKIGRKGRDNGALFLVAKNDKKMRIEVGYGLEGTLTDVTARRIIAENVAPLFREGKFAAGVNAGVDRIISVVAEGKPLPERQAPARSGRGTGGFDLGSFLMILFIGVPVVGGILRAIFGKLLGSAVGAGVVGAAAWFLAGSLLIAATASVIGFIVMIFMGSGLGAMAARSGGMWSSGGGGFGGGGGGGFSGGGGSFGGGGASGGW